MQHKSINNLKAIKNKVETLDNRVEIIAVSKTHEMTDIQPLINFGHKHFGENKVQEAINKWSDHIKDFNNVNLHMIGKLQTNKVKQAVQIFDYIHSLDSEKLAKKIAKEQKKIDKSLKIFIQINIDNEINKSGISIDELDSFYQYTVNELNLNIIGLMCIPAINKNSKFAFQLMKNLSDKIGVKEISMGMSADYMDAIKFGASFIRIGTDIFGKRNY